ncbi:MAG: hypothetical protein Q7T48_07590 [Cellvibrio sp.]|uniref:hypothetical protein n=1 Tax=Cellvibrio sp. TaxID=1965322 RepID=UPI0027261B81|nr:hypothetical protein [Cellvibrio sp.]
MNYARSCGRFSFQPKRLREIIGRCCISGQYIDSDDLQTLSLSDPWLFENGLMEYLKSLAHDYENGKL